MINNEDPMEDHRAALAEHDSVPLHPVFDRFTGEFVDVPAVAEEILRQELVPKWQKLAKNLGSLAVLTFVASSYGYVIGSYITIPFR
jgi:hypothetical protein